MNVVFTQSDAHGDPRAPSLRASGSTVRLAFSRSTYLRIASKLERVGRSPRSISDNQLATTPWSSSQKRPTPSRCSVTSFEAPRFSSASAEPLARSGIPAAETFWSTQAAVRRRFTMPHVIGSMSQEFCYRGHRQTEDGD
jgi:hypothetical protein